MLETEIAKISQEVKQNLKISDDKDIQVARYIKRAKNQVLISCNRQDVPELLYDVIAQIAEDMLKADGIAPVAAEVSSIARGDTSISYRDKSGSQKQTVDYMKNYESQLAHFRKVKLPGGKKDE